MSDSYNLPGIPKGVTRSPLALTILFAQKAEVFCKCSKTCMGCLPCGKLLFCCR